MDCIEFRCDGKKMISIHDFDTKQTEGFEKKEDAKK